MNVNTGELRMMKENLTDLMEGFTPVPVDLEEEARKELDGNDYTFVDMKKETPLTAWAKSQQTTKKKNKKSIQKKSKRINRNK